MWKRSKTILSAANGKASSVALTYGCHSGDFYGVYDEKWVVQEKGLSAWNKFLKVPERESCEVSFLALEWGRIQRITGVERSTAIRDAVQSLKDARKISDVGPDWTLIGPGDAYVRALAKEGRGVAEAELRPEQLPDGPITLIRDSKEVRGYSTLNTALEAAQDQDDLEIRTDGPLGVAQWKGDSRLLTIRAAAGYTPLIDGLRSEGTDRLILEGLSVRGSIHGSGNSLPGWTDEKAPLGQRGGILKVMNCSIPDTESGQQVHGWMVSANSVVPEILNCEITTLNLGLFAGGTARLRNSLISQAYLGVENQRAVPGTLEIDRCAFWLPEPDYMRPMAHLLALSPIRITADRSLFVSPTHLFPGTSQTWTGTANVYMKPYEFQRGVGPISLEQFQAEFKTDTDSIELPPWEFDPAQWRILRDKSPGYEPRSDGTDYGADIDRLIQAIGR